MAEQHPDMLTGEWIVHEQNKAGAPIVDETDHYSMTTWRNSGTRFFATLIISYENVREKVGVVSDKIGVLPIWDYFWNIWITAACGKTAAENFKAEVRLSSSALPECSLIYFMPVNHFESDILVKDINLDSLSTYKSSLRLHHEIVGKHMCPTSHLTSKLMVSGTDIPFKCLVHKKIFLALDKADFEAKEETDERKEKQDGSK